MTTDFDKAIREAPAKADYAAARVEAIAILKEGKALPKAYVTLFKMAYLAGVQDARANNVIDLNSIPEKTQTVQKTVQTPAKKGATTTMATSNKVSERDLQNMQRRIQELDEQVSRQLDGFARIEKMALKELVSVAIDPSLELKVRNFAADVILQKHCADDATAFSSLIRREMGQ